MAESRFNFNHPFLNSFNKHWHDAYIPFSTVLWLNSAGFVGEIQRKTFISYCSHVQALYVCVCHRQPPVLIFVIAVINNTVDLYNLIAVKTEEVMF